MCIVLIYKELLYKQLGDKVKNEMRNEKSDPIVLARKRKNDDGSVKRSPKVQVVQRGIVNWEPPAIDGEDERSCKAHIAWMQKEKKKRQYNTALVEKKMELTYSFRRKMVNTGQHILKEIKLKYPFLFDESQVCMIFVICQCVVLLIFAVWWTF